MARGHCMTLDDRKELKMRWESGESVAEIAREIGVCVSTIYGELYRGSDGFYLPDGRETYLPELGAKKYHENRKRQGRKKAETNFRDITKSAEALAEFLEGLNVTEGPWDKEAWSSVCATCGEEECDGCEVRNATGRVLAWLRGVVRK